ncbi:TOMM precursor leader peptide-binding protein [Streptomyces sp. NBC_01198]|uniref:TOMM precursor leader peptide-binding protein n=1 Tax=Streptomyces sp. NBC_01198 TaxID=2903769 RepID=UPI002E127422|nr:TOMM precursor leader peptide-binding protein [Streptomyces sp. NBC_01198]
MPEAGATAGPWRLAGSGVLHDAVERLLPPGGGQGGAVVAVSDGWDPALITASARAAAADGMPFLGVRVEFGQVLVGPTVLPGRAGCTGCLDARRAAADPAGAADRAALLAARGDRPAPPSTWLTAFAVPAVAGVVAAELRALAQGRTPRTVGAVLVVELDRLTTGVHPFLPDPSCATCAPAGDPAGARRAAAVGLTARPKPDPSVLRATDLVSRAAELERVYVDGTAGLVRAVRERDACGLPVAYAYTGLPGVGRPEPGIGRGADRRSARAAALLEAVERRAGTVPSGRWPVERAAYADVRGHAVDPRTLGLPGGAGEAAQLDPREERAWVWGFSFGRGEPVLVPAEHAYFGPLPGAAGRSRVHETSNGCALGGCYEEAVLHGLLEVAERDAFLLTWYARMPVPRVAIGSARSSRVRLLADRVDHAHGYEVLAFDTSLEHGVPSVALLAVDRSTDPLRPAVMCAAAAHPDPEHACWSALTELALLVAHLPVRYPAERARAAAMAADSDLVTAMTDHELLYGHRDTLPRWDFLLDRGSAGQRTFEDSFTGRPAPAADLRDDLTGLLDRYRRAGLDVVAVDQTGPEQRAAGLSSVRVIVPGTLPMTFGHRNRRLTGLPRLRTVPMLLGHRGDPLPEDEISPYPHPFP